MKDKPTSGEAIRQLRRQLDLNQTIFWSRIGITQSGGCRYESGRNIPKPVQLLIELAYSNEKSANELLNDIRGGNHG